MAKVPNGPFEDVAVDLFYLNNKCYLVHVDHLSYWFELHQFNRDPATRGVITQLWRWFCSLGLSTRLPSDNGPKFRSSEFSSFVSTMGVGLSLTTPYNPCSNGLAESALLAKSCPDGNLDSDYFVLVLLEFRNTPVNTGFSPSQVVFVLRSSVPNIPASYTRQDLQPLSLIKFEKSLKRKLLQFGN
eukprot:maker-scaffold994_size72573-snap-gene-0.15 protein:Tk02418 transcript:maker-scaffold994_size72573-snap-gene-0.15-mRNA-1 annotation:"hypothetical protein DAPPUDRAFT_269522"